MSLSIVIYRLLTIIAIVSYYVYDGYVSGYYEGISQTYYQMVSESCYYLGMPCLFYEMGTIVLTNTKKMFYIIFQASLLFGIFCLMSYLSFGKTSQSIILDSWLLIGAFIALFLGFILKNVVIKGPMSHWLAFPLSIIFIIVLIFIIFEIETDKSKMIDTVWLLPSFACGLFYKKYGLAEKDKKHIVQSEMVSVTFVVLISELFLFNQFNAINEIIVVKKALISITGMLFSHFLFVDLQMSDNSLDSRISRVFPPIATSITSFIICDCLLKRQEIVNLGSSNPILYPILFIILVLGLSVSIIYLLLILRDYVFGNRYIALPLQHIDYYIGRFFH